MRRTENWALRLVAHGSHRNTEWGAAESARPPVQPAHLFGAALAVDRLGCRVAAAAAHHKQDVNFPEVCGEGRGGKEALRGVPASGGNAWNGGLWSRRAADPGPWLALGGWPHALPIKPRMPT